MLKLQITMLSGILYFIMKIFNIVGQSVLDVKLAGKKDIMLGAKDCKEMYMG